jgi:adenine-specific DNA-methyltransferase
MKNIFEQLTDLLKKDERLVSQDSVLLKNQTQELARKNDSVLIKLLLSDKTIKQHFFFEVEKTLIFDKEKFIRFISNKQFLPDSYTAFKNKIGLTAGDDYLSENKEVVLVWPYKDCVLEGGMTKEDQKRDEIFYNETLAPDDINRLLDAKIFTNFKRIDKKGEHKLDGFNRDEKGTIKDNLIIKGNNLLALASLKKEFAGKVKLIYIDPPYNTGNDGFKYNDSFNHSSWLVFMKNRLEIAKQLLSDDGSIYIQLDHNEVHYGRVLMDEIFGKNNFQREIIWYKGNTFGYAASADNFVLSHDSILFYSKSSNKLFNKLYESYSEEYVKKRFVHNDNDGKGLYRIQGKNQRQYFNESKGIAISDVWTIPVINVMATEKIFDTQKPETLLQRVIEASSNQEDIVLDFMAGSGTTLAVAHKTGRQYIGIEQMDYIHELPESRLKKVIAGEQGGISKAVNWKGGRDFVYMELAEWNNKWIRKIRDIKTGKELAKLWDEMKKTAFLSYKVEPKTIDASVKDFTDLSIADQKKFLIECLDKNQLYVNLSEIEDKEYGVDKEDRELNKNFYGIK